MNLVEKILARASGRSHVEPGDIVVAEVDRDVFHDLSGYITSNVYEARVDEPIRDPDRLVMVFDHTFSPPTEHAADILEHNREFAAEHGLQLFDSGSGNIHHTVVRNGLIEPGMVVVGSDSHTPVHGVFGAFATGIGNDSHAGLVFPYSKTWFPVPETVKVEIAGSPPPGTTARDVALKLTGDIGEGGANSLALEFAGEYVDGLSVWDRWLLTLTAVDVGAQATYVEPDDTTTAFCADVGIATERLVTNDDDVEYADVWHYDVSDLEPQIACPPTVGNVKPVTEVAGTTVDFAEIGGHGGGRFEDVETLAAVIPERGLDDSTLLNLVPSSRAVFAEALEAGYVASLHGAGGTWYPPSTGSNQAVNMGAMTANQAMVSTHARNFPGRNGSPEASMYLASALTVAASASTGELTDPREVIDG